jgi:hypothetical protein
VSDPTKKEIGAAALAFLQAMRREHASRFPTAENRVRNLSEMTPVDRGTFLRSIRSALKAAQTEREDPFRDQPTS